MPRLITKYLSEETSWFVIAQKTTQENGVGEVRKGVLNIITHITGWQLLEGLLTAYINIPAEDVHELLLTHPPYMDLDGHGPGVSWKDESGNIIQLTHTHEITCEYTGQMTTTINKKYEFDSEINSLFGIL